MMWGCISADGVGELAVCEGRMNAQKYISVLTEHLQPSIFKLFPEDNPNYIFQQDSAPCHTAHVVKKFFTDSGVPVLDWPSQSPDLNPIEHLWFHVKKEIRKKSNSNKKELEKAVFEVWEAIPRQLTRQLVESMPRRISAVLKAKVRSTKY